jgi:hypothetical protein
MKYWEIIADDLSRRGWSWGYTSLVSSPTEMTESATSQMNF